MKVRWRNGTKTEGITQYVESVDWEGSDTQTSRMATISIAFHYERNMCLGIKLGDIISLNENDDIFVGVVTYAERKGDAGTVSYTAKDFMHYFIRSKGSYNFKNTTPEKMTKKICDDLLVRTADLYKTKTHIKSLLFESELYYSMIVTAYNEASRKMSAECPPVFMPIMKGNRLCVIVKGKSSGITLDGEKDITSSAYSQSTDEMATRVVILNKNGKKSGVVEHTKNLRKYGVYQETYKKEDDKNAKDAAKQLLYGITREASVESLGHIQCVAGYSVRIKDKASGLTGTFYIESDRHTWKDGIHTMELTLKFSNELEEV